MNRLGVAILALGLALGTPLPAAADTDGAVSPAGFTALCMRNPSLCAPHFVAPPIPWTRATEKRVEALHRWVNWIVDYQPSADWTGTEPGHGDCKTYALLKWQLLADYGFQSRIAVTRTPQGALHAIVILDTSVGPMVLDSIIPDIRPLSATGYPILSIQEPGYPQIWTDPHAPLPIRSVAR